jgi:hypothetical protein
MVAAVLATSLNDGFLKSIAAHDETTYPEKRGKEKSIRSSSSIDSVDVLKGRIDLIAVREKPSPHRDGSWEGGILRFLEKESE